MKPNRCPLCDRGAVEVAVAPDESFLIDCKTCGGFQVSEETLEDGVLWKNGIKTKRYLLSALVRESTDRFRVDDDLIERLRSGSIQDKRLQDKIRMIVQYYAARSNEIGQRFKLDDPGIYPAAWCRSQAEWDKLVEGIAADRGDLMFNGSETSVTMKGWERLEDRPNTQSAKGFIAMSFDPSLDTLSDAIHEGVRKAGYEPYRVKEDHFVGGVMDRIIARIRESRFVVSDLTQNRGGVYYEAGFAAGLGVPVFLLSEAGQLNPKNRQRIHFDVAHANVLPWTQNNLAELTTRLRDRILAVIGRGPIMS